MKRNYVTPFYHMVRTSKMKIKHCPITVVTRVSRLYIRFSNGRYQNEITKHMVIGQTHCVNTCININVDTTR